MAFRKAVNDPICQIRSADYVSKQIYVSFVEDDIGLLILITD